MDSDHLVQSLIHGRHDAANEVLDAWIARGCRYEEIAVCGIQPALYEIGRLWEEGRVSVAEEHVATAIAQALLVRAFEAATFVKPRPDRALFACVPRNLHDLGPRVLSDTFAIAGWDVEFLGANVATDDLIRRIETWQPHFVGLSLSLPEHVESAHQTVAEIQNALGKKTARIVLGGGAVDQLARAHTRPEIEIWQADATEALGLL